MKVLRGKFLALILILLIFLSGCAKQEKGVVTLRWVSDPNPIRKEQIALFEKTYPMIKVNLDWTSAGLEKILTQIAGGAAPDLIDIHSRATFNIFAEKGVLLDLTPYCKKYNVDLEDLTDDIRLRVGNDKLTYIGKSQITNPFGKILNRANDKEVLEIVEINPKDARNKNINEFNTLF